MRFSLLPPLGSTGEGTAVSEKLRSSGWKQKNACWRPKSKKSGSSWGWRGGVYSGAPPTEMEAPPPCSCNLVPPNTTALSRSQDKVPLIAVKNWEIKNVYWQLWALKSFYDGRSRDLTLFVQAAKTSMSPGGPSYDGCIFGWKPSWWDPTAPWYKVYQVLEDEEHWNSQLECWHKGKQRWPTRYSIQYSINSNNSRDTDPNHVRNISWFKAK